MSNSPSVESIAFLACGSLIDLIRAYIAMWRDDAEEWYSYNIGEPVRKLLIVSNPGMLAEAAISKVLSESDIHFIKDNPSILRDRYLNLRDVKEKVIVFSTYPASNSDEKALLDLLKVTVENKNIFLISLVDNKVNKTLKNLYDDVIHVSPPSELRRREIFNLLFKYFIDNGLMDNDLLDYIVKISEGFTTQNIISFTRRLVARSHFQGSPISRDLIDEIYLDLVGVNSSHLETSYDLDLLEQLYIMAVEENESSVFSVIKKLNEELPLSKSDQRVLSRYPFLLLGTPDERLKLFFKARSLVKKFTEERGEEE